MEQSQLYIILGVLFLITIGLGIYLFRIVRKIGEQRQSLTNNFDHLNDSLRTLALTITQDQVELSEGCIRVAYILNYHDDFKKRDEYAIFFEMYEKIKDFSILKNRKELSKQEVFEQDKQRFKIEDVYRERIKIAAQYLLVATNVSKIH